MFIKKYLLTLKIDMYERSKLCFADHWKNFVVRIVETGSLLQYTFEADGFFLLRLPFLTLSKTVACLF